MSDENNFKPTLEGYKPLRPFNLFMKNNFPFIENTFEALDTYGLLCEIVKYLNVAIENVNTTEENINILNTAFDQLNDYVSNYFDNLDVQEEIDNKLDEMATTGVLQQLLTILYEDINENVASLQADVNTLSARMDTFTELTEGSTTGDAELADARIGNNGYINNNVGNSIRGQTAYSNSKIDDLLSQVFNMTNVNDWNCAEGTFDETGYISNTGENAESANYKRTSDYIELSEKPTLSNIYFVRITGAHNAFSIACYDEDKEYLFTKSLGSTSYYGGWDFSGVKYVRLYTNLNYTGLVYLSWYAAPNNEPYYNFSKVNSIKENFYITQLESKKVVNFGDSLFGNYRGDTSISAYIANSLKNTTYNVGFGGCRMSARNDTTWNAFSMCNLADAIADNDFTLQDAAVADETWLNKPDYFDTQLALLKTINFNNVDMITIGYGTNDYTAGVDLDNANDPEDKFTIAGALRYTIKTIQTAFPDIKILVLSNCWRYFPNESNITSDTKQYNGHTGIDVKNCILNTAKEMRVPCLDSYENLSLSLYNATNYMEDGTHLAQKGRSLYGELIGGKIKTLY